MIKSIPIYKEEISFSRLLNTPHFAPEYVFNGKRYLSPLEIILEKGSLKLNRGTLEIIDHSDFLFCPPNHMIDSEIKRVGFKWKLNKNIRDRHNFISLVIKAMYEDARKIEEEFPDYTIIALVGGKDSLNMLLLPWKNPIIVASAEPNYPLVKKFLQDNSLKYDLIKLEDDINLDIEREILINCCRLNLEHCRWTGHLEDMVKMLNGKALILLGQWGDVLFSSKWKRNIQPPREFHFVNKINKFHRKFHVMYKKIEFSFLRKNYSQRLFFNNLWYESAHWQGVHMSLLNEYIGCPVLSIYHNENVMNVICQTDYESVVTYDLRSQIGRQLFEGEVHYPITNPSPPPSEFRKGISGSKQFIDLIQKIKIPVI